MTMSPYAAQYLSDLWSIAKWIGETLGIAIIVCLIALLASCSVPPDCDVHRLSIGMSWHALEDVCGKPRHINHYEAEDDHDGQWVYWGAMVYVEKGKVTNWQWDD